MRVWRMFVVSHQITPGQEDPRHHCHCQDPQDLVSPFLLHPSCPYLAFNPFQAFLPFLPYLPFHRGHPCSSSSPPDLRHQPPHLNHLHPSTCQSRPSANAALSCPRGVSPSKVPPPPSPGRTRCTWVSPGTWSFP